MVETTVALRLRSWNHLVLSFHVLASGAPEATLFVNAVADASATLPGTKMRHAADGEQGGGGDSGSFVRIGSNEGEAGAR